jgi:hypothetical protein
MKSGMQSNIQQNLPSLHSNFRILLYLCTVFLPEEKFLQPNTTS